MFISFKIKNMTTEEKEFKKTLELLLEKHDKKKIAKILGISRTTLYRHFEKLNIEMNKRSPKTIDSLLKKAKGFLSK